MRYNIGLSQENYERFPFGSIYSLNCDLRKVYRSTQYFESLRGDVLARPVCHRLRRRVQDPARPLSMAESRRTVRTHVRNRKLVVWPSAAQNGASFRAVRGDARWT